MKITIVGKGKVGTALARAFRRAGHEVTLRAGRARAQRFDPATTVILLAVRDAALPAWIASLAASSSLPPRTVVLHVAGSVGADVLSPLRSRAAGVGVAHPLLSFADARRPPTLAGAQLLVSGDALAVRRAKQLGRSVGMVPRVWPKIDFALYHAAAALTANGAVALVAAAAALLESAGAPKGAGVRALAPLLASVARNVEAVGLPRALTGPIRRGDAATVERHLRALHDQPREIEALYRAVGLLQVSLAEALGEAGPARLAALRRLLRAGRRASPRRAR